MKPFREALAETVKLYLDEDARDLESMVADLRAEADGIDAMIADEEEEEAAKD